MSRELWIDGRRLADDEPCYVVAELSGNHGGSLTTAETMISEAARAGASAVKLVKRDIDTLYTQDSLDAPYENEWSYGRTYGLHRHALEFNAQAYIACQAAAAASHVTLYATAFDEPSVDFLVSRQVPAIKIHSGGLTDERLLRYASQCGKPLIVSTGGATMEDIDRAVDWLGPCPHALLHCTASYPVAAREANLRVITTLRDRFPLTVIGWSSHYPGLALSLAAYTLGARILEHHFTLNRAERGTDHGFSLEPKGLATLVEDVEKLRLAFGDGVKRIYESERGPMRKMRRVLTQEGWKIALQEGRR